MGGFTSDSFVPKGNMMRGLLLVIIVALGGCGKTSDESEYERGYRDGHDEGQKSRAAEVDRAAQMQAEADMRAASSQVKALQTGILKYRIDMRRLPAQLADLVELPADEEERRHWRGGYLAAEIRSDPWGSEYVYRPDPDGGNFTLFSPGPDRIPETADDIARAR